MHIPKIIPIFVETNKQNDMYTQLQRSILPNESKVNIITTNKNGTYRLTAINRKHRGLHVAMNGKEYKEFKTIKGAANTKVAQRNGGITVIVDPTLSGCIILKK